MLSKIYGVMTFLCLILAPGAAESGMYITTAVLVAGVGIFAYLSMKEDGQIRHKKKPRNRGWE